MNPLQVAPNCINCSMACVLAKLTNPRIVENLVKKVRDVTFHKGETIYKQQSFVSQVVFIREGLVKLVLEGTSGKNFVVRLYTSQDYLGLMQLFQKSESRYTVIALKNTKVCMIEINFFRELLLEHAHINEKLITNYVEEIDLLYHKLSLLGTKSIHGRFADVLLYLLGDKLRNEDVYRYLSRKEIAEMAGMSVESMIRLFNEFKNDQIIEISNKNIQIKNLPIVETLSRVG